MSNVDVVLTDTRLWARSESTHWDGPPSIVPASDGSSFVVGEQLRPQYPAVSMVRMAEADRIAFAPSLAPPILDAWAVTIGAVLTNLRLPSPCEELTIVGPSEWGRRRRAAVASGARRMVSRVNVDSLAVRAASLGASTAQQQRIAVLELNPLSTTVSLIGRSGQDTWTQACEHEPAVGLADVEEGHGLPGVVAVIARLLAGQPPSHLLALGISDPSLLEALSAALAQQCGFPVDVRPLTGVELIRGARAGMPTPAAAAAQLPPPEYASLHEQAIATQPPRSSRRTLVYAAAAAVVVVLVLIAAGVAIALSGSGAKTTAASTTTTSAPGSPVSRGPATPQTFGRLQVQIPAGWHIASQVGDRVDLSPDNGARERITLMQKSLTPGAGVDDVADSLAAQIARRPAGQVSSLQRNAVFAGRSGLSYEEFPGDGSTVHWQILVDADLEVSVGCQYLQGKWAPLEAPCERFVQNLVITQ